MFFFTVTCILAVCWSSSAKSGLPDACGHGHCHFSPTSHSLLQRSHEVANTFAPQNEHDGRDSGETVTALASDTYVPGTPGKTWTQAEVLAVKAKLWRIFAVDEAGHIYKKLKPDTKFVAWRDYLRPAPKVLRLGFHDCLRYHDGSGGCDGCLMWEGVGNRYSTDTEPWTRTSNDTLSHNNGLTAIVEMLEAIYTDRSFPERTAVLPKSLRDSGKSRADLWALAAIVAVEYGIEINNGVCQDPNYELKHHRKESLDFNGVPHCHHLQGKSDCKAKLHRPIVFMTGRRDCVTDMTEGYMTSKAEIHPDGQGDGRATAEFFNKEFGFTGRETVAIMGAHTMGRVHYQNSLFRYVWVKNGGMMFNNQYYRNLVGKKDYRFVGNSCDRAGDADGNAPVARWVAHVRMDMDTGGPAQFIQEKWICPEVCATADAHKNSCCLGGNRCNKNCLDWRFANGLDETALPAEMGLYLDFNLSSTKLPTGCPGLKYFTADEFRKGYHHTWSGTESGKPGATGCRLQTYALPATSTPMSKIVEEYAGDQAAWLHDFVPAIEKMLTNGYAADELKVGPDQWTDVLCPAQDSRGAVNRFWACYDRRGLSKPFMLKSLLDGRVVQESSDASGNFHMATTKDSKPANLRQVWRKTAKGDHLVNVASGNFLVIYGQGSFTLSDMNPFELLLPSLDRSGTLVAPDGKGLDRGWVEEDGERLTTYKVHGNINQQWEMLPVDEDYQITVALRKMAQD
mmetsp:Transcript_103571/g.194981  ORF Transcript_103571/g.194981 Transcript_103571/m.194981 type:complete len:737 (+) Transcript_103571:92-2302(+)